MAIKAQLDDDVTMSSESNVNEKQVIFRGRSRGSLTGARHYSVSQRSRLPQHANKLKQTLIGDCSYYKVNVMNGQQYEKEFIIKSLMNRIAPNTFIPIMVSTNTFFQCIKTNFN